MKHTKGKVTLSDDGLGLWGFNAYSPINQRSIMASFDCASRTEKENEANAERVMECWNACEGIENPGAIKELIEAQKAMFEWVDKFPGVDGPEALRVKKALAALGVK